MPFNVNELIKAAAQSVNKYELDVKSFRKMAEGGFNKVFEITIDDGMAVIARLPFLSTMP